VYAIVGTLVVFGIAVRVRQYLGRPSYWCDEAWTVLNAVHRSWSELLEPLDWHQVQPPAFLWILRGLYLLGGSSELMMRAPALAAGVLSIGLMIPLARRYVTHPSWLWAVALCALSHHGLTHALQAKAYSSDLLVTELVLLSVGSLAQSNAAPPQVLRPGIAVLVMALLAPWLSYPSFFVFGSIGLALSSYVGRRRIDWLRWGAVAAPVLGAALVLWWRVVRGIDHPFFREYFGTCFPDRSSWHATLGWLVSQLVHIGHYGTTGMGVPLLLLAGLGLAWSARHRPAAAVLLMGPIGLAALAAAAHRYPLCERLIFFALPCFWLLATEGIGVLAARLRPGLAWITPVLLLVLLAPGAVRMAGDLVEPRPATAFRDAFEFVQERRRPGERLWVATPEVFELYYGPDAAVLSQATPVAVVEEAARRDGLWMISYRPNPGEPRIQSTYPGLPAHAVTYRAMPGLEVFHFAPVLQP
jgi:hypothetical protein